jgi:hypothetical protein
MPGGDDEDGMLAGAELAVYYFVEAAYEEADVEDLDMAIAALASAAVPETFAAAAVLDIDTSAAGGDPNAAAAGQTFNELDDYWQAASAAEQSQWLASNDQTSAGSARERGEIPVFTPSNSLNPTSSTVPGGQTFTIQITVGPAPNPDLELNSAIQEAVGPYDPGPTPQPGDISDVLAGTDWTSLLNPQTPSPATQPYDPMADSPFARALLYGDTPHLDFLTNDSHLAIAQYSALGVAALAGAGAAVAGLAAAGAGAAIASAADAAGTAIAAAAEAAEASIGATLRSAGQGLARLMVDTEGSVTLSRSVAKAGPIVGALAAAGNAVLRTNPNLGQQVQAVSGAVMGEAAELGSLSADMAATLANDVTLAEEADSVLLAESSSIFPRLHLHHIFPKASNLRPLFENLGFDIDKYAIPLDPYIHGLLHEGSDPGGEYNARWVEFFEDNEFATPQQIYNFAVELLNELELAGPDYPIVPYLRR